MLSQDREDGADVLNMLLRVRRVDDDIVQDPHVEDVEVLSEDVVHEGLEHRWSVGRPLGAHGIFKVPLPTPKRCFPFIPFPDPHLVVCVSQI